MEALTMKTLLKQTLLAGLFIIGSTACQAGKEDIEDFLSDHRCEQVMQLIDDVDTGKATFANTELCDYAKNILGCFLFCFGHTIDSNDIEKGRQFLKSVDYLLDHSVTFAQSDKRAKDLTTLEASLKAQSYRQPQLISGILELVKKHSLFKSE